MKNKLAKEIDDYHYPQQQHQQDQDRSQSSPQAEATFNFQECSVNMKDLSSTNSKQSSYLT